MRVPIYGGRSRGGGTHTSVISIVPMESDEMEMESNGEFDEIVQKTGLEYT